MARPIGVLGVEIVESGQSAVANSSQYAAAREAIQQQLRASPDNVLGLMLSASIEFQLGSFGQAEANKKYPLSFITKVAKSDGVEKADEPSKYDSYFDEKNNIINSETRQLKLDANRGVMEINSDKVQGAVGALKDLSINLPFISFKVKNSWASLFIISKDDKPLSESKRFYLVAVTPVKMTGQKYNAARTALEEPGHLPLQAQQLEGDLFIKGKVPKMKITSLQADGTKYTYTDFVVKSDGVSIKLNDGKTFVYEIEIE